MCRLIWIVAGSTRPKWRFRTFRLKCQMNHWTAFPGFQTKQHVSFFCSNEWRRFSGNELYIIVIKSFICWYGTDNWYDHFPAADDNLQTPWVSFLWGVGGGGGVGRGSWGCGVGGQNVTFLTDRVIFPTFLSLVCACFRLLMTSESTEPYLAEKKIVRRNSKR